MGIQLGLDIRPQRRKRIERLGAGPLAFTILDRTVTDILGGGVTQNITCRGGWRHVTHPASNDDAELSLKVRAMGWKWHFDFAAIRDYGSAGLDPNERL